MPAPGASTSVGADARRHGPKAIAPHPPGVTRTITPSHANRRQRPFGRERAKAPAPVLGPLAGVELDLGGYHACVLTRKQSLAAAFAQAQLLVLHLGRYDVRVLTGLQAQLVLRQRRRYARSPRACKVGRMGDRDMLQTNCPSTHGRLSDSTQVFQPLYHSLSIWGIPADLLSLRVQVSSRSFSRRLACFGYSWMLASSCGTQTKSVRHRKYPLHQHRRSFAAAATCLATRQLVIRPCVPHRSQIMSRACGQPPRRKSRT